MSTITEQAAQRYAAAVIGVLVDASLIKRELKPFVLEQVARQAEAPMASFELVVSDLPSANWRLMPNLDDRQRVCIGCFKLHPTRRDDALEDSVNRALGNIPLREER